MLFIKLKTLDQDYALAVTAIVEIVPYVALHPYPDAPDYIAGMLNFRGAVVPVIDLVMLLTGKSATHRLSTRIVLINYPAKDHKTHIVGILAESITATESFDDTAFINQGYQQKDKPFLGKVICNADGIIQKIEPIQLLPPDLEDNLLTQQKGPR